MNIEFSLALFGLSHCVIYYSSLGAVVKCIISSLLIVMQQSAETRLSVWTLNSFQIL